MLHRLCKKTRLGDRRTIRIVASDKLVSLGNTRRACLERINTAMKFHPRSCWRCRKSRSGSMQNMQKELGDRNEKKKAHFKTLVGILSFRKAKRIHQKIWLQKQGLLYLFVDPNREAGSRQKFRRASALSSCCTVVLDWVLEKQQLLKPLMIDTWHVFRKHRSLISRIVDCEMSGWTSKTAQNDTRNPA